MKDNKHRYCLRPFTNLEITSYEFASCCCGAWLPDFNAGDIEKQTLNEIWNSSPMQRIRKSILDGSYNFCNKVSCPYLNSELFKLYTKDELQSVLEAYEKGTDLEPSLCSIKKYAPWISNILDNNTYLDVLPANYNLCYDETCNLKCP
ncbi:MAG TPA: SPASM domain-containing protein, partial [Clostridia bacterium]